jgi:hypothetical protein
MFRASLATRTATGESAVRPQVSRTTARRHHLCTHQSPTTTNVPTKA